MTYDPATAAAKAIDVYDRNRDHKLVAEEIKNSPALAASARRLDSNRDSALTADELQERFENVSQWPKLVGIDMGLTLRGRPLGGAQVTLIPEAFMGEDYPTFSGTTDQAGAGPVMAEGRELPGVPVGFYTVRIVHLAQKIDTMRGVEIASDTTGSRLEIAL